MRGMKEEMDKLRADAADRERLKLTAQSLENRLKERETQVRMRIPLCFVFIPGEFFFSRHICRMA